MTARIVLPRMLHEHVPAEVDLKVSGPSVADALLVLFDRAPGLRSHILDETGAIRPHVSVFVDGRQSDLETPLDDASEVRILHAVSGG